MKKLLPYILILLVVTGFFSSLHNVQAQEKVNQNYTLLQPLPCIADETNADDCKNGLLTSFDPGGTGKLGVYLDFALKLFIGICAVAAVIMIVVGGIELSTSELISKKESAKERIWGAVLGLVLALTSWTILNTINPDLLRTDVDIQKSNLVSEGEDHIKDLKFIPPDSAPIKAGPTAGCSGGIEKSKSGIYACKDVVESLNNMMDAARQGGLNLTGGGYRTNQQQINLRIANCNGNTTDAKYPCRPPTALPGYSLHENGLAIDFNCNGQLIRDRSNSCFVWLKNNASKHGYYNLPSEPWHWSRNGR